MRFARTGLLWIFFIAGIANPVWSETPNASLDLDSFSFFYSEEIQAGGEVPTISIPIHLAQTSGSSWTITIESAAMTLPPIDLPDGTSVQWTLVSQATGGITLGANTGTVEISGEFHAESVETTRKAVHDLSFTTGVATSISGAKSVSREGYPMDRSSGYLQIVAASTDPPGSTHATPFYAVISGRVVDAPIGFLTE